ncbi:MAG: T9SS type A sorting domain-containing protein [Bacteroidales bacterium]|nr:T9SS type A sorting domain-containing protein [Bacteroidales bacterium]
MPLSTHSRYVYLTSGLLMFIATSIFAQNIPRQVKFYSPEPGQRAFDSVVASHLPVLSVPADALSLNLPDSLDNSQYMWFPGILDQDGYYACQQYCGSAYTFAYEMNRLRNVDGKSLENKYPPHYMWHFFNEGERYVGVNFLHSFHAMMEQGHMTNADYGPDTAQLEYGWITGYDKYCRAMKNRIRNIYAIPVNSAEGIQAVKQYLFDHLDGSSTGGIACFTASSPSGYGAVLPENTPEAGKYVMTDWNQYPTHGMTIVGYHDSIRYDLNQDGQYTNDIDINSDGTLDARDWEIGGFRLANSYGGWWSDEGYFYVLYHAMASNFEQGGIWNNCVYIVEPDPDYTPLLTVKIDLEHNRRNQLNIMAGVSNDLEAAYPDNLLQSTIFSNQGGPLYMQGFDSVFEQSRLEFGIDVTPLLSYIEPGVPARFFLIIEERDPLNSGQGIIHEASFIHYGASTHIFPCNPTETTINHHGTTVLSATGIADCDLPVILNEELPPFTSSGNYSVQFQSQGGVSPYSWLLHQPYQKITENAEYNPFEGQQVTPQSSGKPYATVALPFEFPFFGNLFDTIYVNSYGMIHFTDEHIPYPYLCSATDMFGYISAIVPAFSWDFVIRLSDGDGIWMTSSPDSVRFRWQLSLLGHEQQTRVEFGATLFPNGEVSFCFGPAVLEPNSLIVWSGLSSGEKQNTLIHPIFDLDAEYGNSIKWVPPAKPLTVDLSPQGLLAISGADESTIYDLAVRVTDEQRMSTEKHFQLSSGLTIRQELVSNSGYLQHGEPASLNLEVTNISPDQLGEITLKFYCNEAELMITDSTVSTTTLAAGQSIELSDVFNFMVQSELPDQTSLPCRIVATSGWDSWEYRFFLDVSAIELKVSGMEVQDGVNALLDAGETADLAFTLTNLGSLPAEELSVTLSSEDEFFEILSSPTLPAGTLGKKAIYHAIFTVRSSRSTPPGHLTNLELLISNGSSIEIIHPCTLPMGGRPVALINLTSSTTSVALMTHLMDSLQVGYDQFSSIPENLTTYPVAFLILGTAYPGSYALSTTETNQLINYLNNGGNVYMESYASWYYGTAKMLEEMFRFSTQRVSVYYFNDMEGVDGTITEGMDYIYLGSSPYAIFEVIPKGDGFSLMNNMDNPPRCLEFGYAGPVYKTIGTFKEFGHLVNGEPPSRKSILFKRYLDFLEVNIDGPFPYFHADTTHICQWHSVQFIDDSFDNVTSWQWEFPGGVPETSEEKNPTVQYPVSGLYDVMLTISDGEHTQSMHKKKFIHVNICAGIEEDGMASEGIHIFPNPTSDKVYITMPQTMDGRGSIDLIDLRGSVVSSETFENLSRNNEYQVDVSKRTPGIYIVRVAAENVICIKKLVVY